MWHDGTFKGYWWQAKVYDNPSSFGITGGRVSKLAICKGSGWDYTTVVFNHDRGLDINKCPQYILAKILEFCEVLPRYRGDAWKTIHHGEIG